MDRPSKTLLAVPSDQRTFALLYDVDDCITIILFYSILLTSLLQEMLYIHTQIWLFGYYEAQSTKGIPLQTGQWQKTGTVSSTDTMLALLSSLVSAFHFSRTFCTPQA